MPFLATRLALLTALALAGCTSTDPSETERDRLLAAMALWQSQDLQSYHYEFRFVCGECPPAWNHLRRIRVDNGVVTQVADLVAGDLTTIDERSVTIFKLFEDIQLTLDANPWRFSAEYHPTLGYPMSVSVDLRQAVQDDEFGYVAQNLVSLQ